MAQKSQFLGQLVNDGLFFSILYRQLEVFFLSRLDSAIVIAAFPEIFS